MPHQKLLTFRQTGILSRLANCLELKGPAICEIARERLRDCSYVELRALQCEYHEGVLVLRGRVPSYYHKQLAQESVRHVEGVEEILNVVEVFSVESSWA